VGPFQEITAASPKHVNNSYDKVTESLRRNENETKTKRTRKRYTCTLL
jgi:hypothetical protein